MLRAPQPDRSVLSDGRLVHGALRKRSCLACGTAFHATAPSQERVQTIYEADYSLPDIAPKSDEARARAYAQWIQGMCSAPGSVFEAGCGSGALLQELARAWPQASCCGADPALPIPGRSIPGVRLERGFIGDLPHELSDFELILAVNVIEHAPAPGAFLAALRSRLAPGGRIIIICPAAEPPNSELLFFDHLFSLTPNALRIAAAEAGLIATAHLRAPDSVGDFQMIAFAAEIRTAAVQPDAGSFQTLWSEREAYLQRWEYLDQMLADRARSAGRLVAFGGGQTAALLRAYAPCSWARVELIVLDDVAEAWPLGVPVASYDRAMPTLQSSTVLIAAAPRVQGLIAERLRRDNVRSIRWDDLIKN